MSGNKYVVRISPRLFQAVTGKVESREATAELDKELVKQINKISNGYVYFYKTTSGHLQVDYRGGYYEAREFLKEQIEKFIENKVENGDFEEEGAFLHVGTITANDIDLSKFAEVVEKCRKKLEEEKRKQEEIEKYKQRIKEIVEKRDYLVTAGWWSDHVNVEVQIPVEANLLRTIDKLTVYYNDESVKQLENYDITKVLTKYVMQLREENKKLKEQLNKRKEEIIREFYERGETITITDECEKELKVIRVDDEGYY